MFVGLPVIDAVAIAADNAATAAAFVHCAGRWSAVVAPFCCALRGARDGFLCVCSGVPIGVVAAVVAVAVTITAAVICLPTISLWALFGSSLRKFVNDTKIKKIIEYLLAALLVLTGLFILLK